MIVFTDPTLAEWEKELLAYAFVKGLMPDVREVFFIGHDFSKENK